MTRYRATVTSRSDCREAIIRVIRPEGEAIYTATYPLNISARAAVDLLAEHHGLTVHWAPMLKMVTES